MMPLQCLKTDRDRQFTIHIACRDKHGMAIHSRASSQ